MNRIKDRVQQMLKVLQSTIEESRVDITNLVSFSCGYKNSNAFPKLSDCIPFDGVWKTKKDEHMWILCSIDVPDAQDDKEYSFYLQTNTSGWDATNPQFLVYIDGKMTQGMDVNHRSVVVAPGHHDVAIYAYSGMESVSILNIQPFVVTTRLQVRQLYFDIKVPLDILEVIKDREFSYSKLLGILNDTISLIDFQDVKSNSYFESLKKANAYLKEQLYSSSSDTDTKVICIGHTHIDIAWLWTIDQTREKAQRSFATVLKLMELYDDYKFMSSQAYLYQAVKEEAPELYEQIKKRVAEGRWEVEGAMWVEADCNLISGESMVRQLFYGKKFFHDEFGVNSKVLWLPDVFGYSAALPQILRKAGVDRFVTSKISWNDENMMPYDIFYWKGIDGTQVFSYFMTAQGTNANLDIGRGATYNACISAPLMKGTYNRLQQKELSNEALITYGYGDGGGGPTFEFIEEIERFTHPFPTMPKAVFEFAGSFLDRLEDSTKGKKVPLYNGELYLEFHRGTYTSIAKNKRNNRRAEFLLQNLETLSILSSKDIHVWLDEKWHMVLTNQFHDIIPGSSISPVYKRTDREYAALFEEGSQLKEQMYASILKPQKGSFVVYNPTSFAGDGYVYYMGDAYYLEDIPSHGYTTVTLEKTKASTIHVTEQVLENDFIKVQLDDTCRITSIIDKSLQRELLKAPSEFLAFEDYPNCFEAWELRDYYREKSITPRFIYSRIIEHGAERGIQVGYMVADSTILVDILLREQSKNVVFKVHLDWKNPHILLKYVVPLDINTTSATCEIQYGSVLRPTTDNNSWEHQKFEVCCHKYVDFSESNYGVALINDSKFGHSLQENILGLTLIKCSTEPNDREDMGEHQIEFALIPHEGTLAESHVVKEAYRLNNPLELLVGYEAPKRSFVSCDKEDVVIDVVKPADDGNGIIIRLYESMNMRSHAKIMVDGPYTSIVETDLLEQPIETSKQFASSFMVNVKPFEIKTYRLI